MCLIPLFFHIENTKQIFQHLIFYSFKTNCHKKKTKQKCIDTYPYYIYILFKYYAMKLKISVVFNKFFSLITIVM